MSTWQVCVTLTHYYLDAFTVFKKQADPTINVHQRNDPVKEEGGWSTQMHL
jgi:hypothetical protein